MWTLNAVNKATIVEQVSCGTLVIDINEINKKYLSEYKILYGEIDYWQLCEKEGKIIQS